MENTVWDERNLPNPSTIKEGEIYFVAKTAKWFKRVDNTWQDVTYDMMSGKSIVEYLAKYNIMQKRGISIL